MFERYKAKIQLLFFQKQEFDGHAANKPNAAVVKTETDSQKTKSDSVLSVTSGI